MSYATVMVYVDADAVPEQRVRVAAVVADKFNATLIGLSALAVRPAYVSEDALVQDLTQTDVRELRGKLSDRGTWFRAAAGADRRKLEWRAVLDPPNGALAAEARSAHVVAIGQSRGVGDVYTALDPGRAVLETDVRP
jgi:hypothetical protein